MGCFPAIGIGQNAPAFSGIAIRSSNTAFVFKNNTVDYANCRGTGGGASGLIVASGGSIDFEYNYIRDVYDTVFGINGPESPVIYKYNVIENPATSAPGDPEGVHMNSLSWGGGAASNVDIEYNTTFASQSYVGGEFMQTYYNFSGSYNNITESHNTFPYSACKCVSYIMHGSSAYAGQTTTLSGTVLVQDNYFDVTGAFGAFYTNSFIGWTTSGNINMVTGATITP
jgi:hypothetical protein